MTARPLGADGDDVGQARDIFFLGAFSYGLLFWVGLSTFRQFGLSIGLALAHFQGHLKRLGLLGSKCI
jgi:hypothetical protein